MLAPMGANLLFSTFWQLRELLLTVLEEAVDDNDQVFPDDPFRTM